MVSLGVSMVMGIVMGKMEYEGWEGGMVETFAKVHVAMQTCGAWV